jgi:integrase
VSRRKQLPISQRHRKGCTRRRDCDCPWSGRVRLADGTMPRIHGDTYTEAERAYHQLMARRPEPLPDRTTTVRQWAERWSAMNASTWRKNTVLGHRASLRNHIIPGLGASLMTGLRRNEVRLWVAGMRERGAGEPTIDKAVKIAHAMFEAWLADDRVLPRGNPVPPGLAIRKVRAKRWSPTTEQVRAWEAAMYPELRVVLAAEAYFGGRMGEMIALRTEDIGWTGKITSEPPGPQLARLAALPPGEYAARSPSVQFARKLEPDRTPGPMKNDRANRTRPLPRWLAARLAEQFGNWPPVDGWLFVGRRPARGRHAGQGLSLRPYEPTYYCRLVRQAAARAGIELPTYKSSHALRNYCVTVMRANGYSDSDIGIWIGDTGRTVEGHYGAPDPALVTRMAATMDAERTEGRPRLRVVG